jgi:hypothetical protein
MDMLLYSTKLPIVPLPYAGLPVKSKGQRFEKEGGLAPMFVDGRLWVSSQPVGRDAIDFIDQFTNEWIGWDGTQSKTGNDDCLDAVYWAAYAAAGHLMPTAGRNQEKKKKQKNPYAAFSRV